MVAQVSPPADLTTLSVKQLTELKRRWYAEALRDGKLAACQDVVFELGTRFPKKHGANLVWNAGDVKIVLDDWSGALYVMSDGVQVVISTISTRLFVPGPWWETVERAAVVARERIAQRRDARDESERQALLRQLGGAS